MIDTAATMQAFGYEDCGNRKPVIAICPVCENPRTTSKRNADGLCRSCAGKHQDHAFTASFKARHAGVSI